MRSRSGSLLAAALLVGLVVPSQSRATGNVVKLVFVSYPDASSDDLPSWAVASTFADGIENYFNWVSNGHVTLDVEVLKRLDAPGKAWKNPTNASTYWFAEGTPNPNYGDANAWVIQAIHNHYASAPTGGNPHIWEGVDHVFVVHYRSVFVGASLRGVGNLGVPYVPVVPPAGFTADGLSIMLDPAKPNESAAQVLHLEFAVDHEFGHVLTLQHDPGMVANLSGCGSPTLPAHAEFFNMGKYSVMDSWAPPQESGIGYRGYHPLNLVQLGWVSKTHIQASCTPQSITLGDLHSPGGQVLEIGIPGSDQAFLVANHQGTGFDAKYGGTGLLVWHIWPGHGWDLECAGGKQTAPPGMSGNPDPNTWWDALEANICASGSSADLFQPGATFGPATNPNTNLYTTTYQSQTLPSGLTLSVSQGAGTSLAVAFVIADQHALVSPTAGTAYTAQTAGAPAMIAAQWMSCAQQVDVQLSNPTGGSFTTLPGGADLANTGSFTYTVPLGTPPGTAYKVRVIPDDDLGAAMVSASFTIWEVAGASMELKCSTSNSRTFRLSWTSSIATTLGDIAIVTSPQGTVSYPQAPSSGTNHAVEFTTSECAAGTWQFQAFSGHTSGNITGYASIPGSATFGACAPVLSSTLSGPSSLTSGQIGTWTATVCGGTPPYTYGWKRANTCGSSNWNSFGGSGSSANYRPPSPGMCVKSIVTDSQGLSLTKTMFVVVDEPQIEGKTGQVAFALHPSYPAPARGSTAIVFDLPAAADVRLTIYDIAGRRRDEIVAGRLRPGTHQITYDAARLASGVYLCRLAAGEHVATQKLVVLHP